MKATKHATVADDHKAAAHETVAHEKVANHTPHEEGEEGEPWLLSYADMVTLLMCFFILFFSMDKTKGGIADPERLKARLESTIAAQLATGKTDAKSTSAEVDRKTAETKAALHADVKKVLKDTKVVLSLSTPEPAVIEMTILTANFFKSGVAELSNEGRAVVAKIAPRLKALEKGATIEIEGHTDSMAVANARFPSNWELSAARASSVARALEQLGLSSKSLMVSGFGENRPVLAEKDAHGLVDPTAQALNRRLVIKVHLPNGKL